MSELTDAKKALKAAEVALQDALQQRALLDIQHCQNSAEIAHDIKNPLSAMMICFSRIRKNGAGAPSMEISARRLETLEKAAHRILNICNSLLNQYAHDGTGDMPQTMVNISELVNEAHDLFSAQAKERGIEFNAEVSDAFPDLKVDRLNMYRALVNLVSNAIKFTPRGGRVEMRAEIDPKENAVIMVVRDSGVGMTGLQIQQVIDSHLTTVSPHGDTGAGLGLSIVNRFIVELGGRLEITSSQNNGCRVELYFPSNCLCP